MAALLGLQANPSFFRGTQIQVRQTSSVKRSVAPLDVSARYRGKGTDLSKVDSFKHHDNDSGSSEVQIARLSARVQQLTSHLQEHKKDFSTRRGLMKILSQRKQLLVYLQRTDRAAYERCLKELNIRQLKVEA